MDYYRKSKDGCIQYNNNDEMIEEETRRSCGRSVRCGRNNRYYRKSPRHPFQGSRKIDLGICAGSSRNRSSLAFRRTLPVSLYPTIIDDIIDNENAGALNNRECPSLRRRNLGGNKKNDNLRNVKFDLKAELAPSKLPCVLNNNDFRSVDILKCGNVPLSTSPFYREGLNAVEVIEDGDCELLLKRRRQDGKVSLESESLIRPAKDVNSFDFFDVNTSRTTSDDTISPLYREAVKIPRFAEEEELDSLQYPQQKRSEEEQWAGGIDEKGDIKNAGITTKSKPSSFYRSALTEAMIAEKVGTDDTFKEDEEGRFMVSIVNDETNLIHQRSSNNSVNEPELRSGLIFDPDGVSHRSMDKGRGKKFWSTSYFGSYDAILPPILARAEPVKFSSSHLQRIHSNSSISSMVDLPIGMKSASSDRSSSSTIDNSSFPVTRSITVPHSKNCVVPVMRENSAANSTKMKMFFRGIHRSRNSAKDAKEEDEELRLAIYLSRFKLSSDSVLRSKDALSAALSTGGTRSISEEKIEEELYNDQIFESWSTIENNDFLMSQFKAMKECQKKNSRNYQNFGISCRSSPDRPISVKNRFHITTGAATSTPPSLGKKTEARRRSELETRGIKETRKAISNGSSHVVKCKGCRGRLQAPVDYSLVFCPKCQTVSPA